MIATTITNEMLLSVKAYNVLGKGGHLFLSAGRMGGELPRHLLLCANCSTGVTTLAQQMPTVCPVN